MATPLENLQSAYASVCEKIAEVIATPRPSYTVDGVTVDRNTFLQQLMQREEDLRKIPGVGSGAGTAPVFDVHADPGAC